MNTNRELRNVLQPMATSIIVLIIFLFAYSGEVFFSFVTEFTAVVLGLWLGFSIDRYRQAQKREHDRKDLLRDLRSELVEIGTKLTGARFPDRLRVVTWDSAIASGQLRLLTSGQMRSFADVYNYIKEVDEDAEKVRGLHTEYEKVKPAGQYVRADISSGARAKLKMVLDRSVDNHKIRESQLREKIEKIVKEDWWEKMSEKESRCENRNREFEQVDKQG